MATEYSLLTCLGKDGRAVTRSGNTLSTAAAHYLRVGNPVRFTGTPPGGLSTGTTYYVISAGFTSTAFRVSTTVGGSEVTLTSAGTSPKVIGAYWDTLASGSGTTGRARYGSAGSERVYDSYNAWKEYVGTTGNKNVSTAIVLEIQGAWDDTSSSYASGKEINGYYSVEINTKPGGTRDSLSFHNGTPGAGYVRNNTNDNHAIGVGMTTAQPRFTLDGVEVKNTVSGSKYTGAVVWIGTNAVIKNNIATCVGGTPGSTNVACFAESGTGAGSIVYNNIALGDYRGFVATDPYYGVGSLWYNNLATGCSNAGFYQGGGSGSENNGAFINNISVGNSAGKNWGTTAPKGYCTNNGGESGDTVWAVGTGATSLTTFVTTANTDFVNLAGNNFNAYSSSSKQVDAGMATPFASMEGYDMNGNVRPCYNNGGATIWDMGPLEFDLGYGPYPLVRNLAISGLVSGSQVYVYATGTTTTVGTPTDSSGATYSYDPGVDGVTVDFTIMKAGYRPIHVTGFPLDSVSNPYVAQQVVDYDYLSASSGLTYTTNCTVNTSTKVVALNTTSTINNLYAFLIELYIARVTAGDTSFMNKDFNFAMDGPDGLIFQQGWETRDWGGTGNGYSNNTLTKLSRGGLRYLDTGGVTTSLWCGIVSLGTDASLYVRYRQAVAGAVTTLSGSGPMDQLLQIKADGSHGGVFDYTGYLQLKAPLPGWSNPKFDAYSTYGTLSYKLYAASLAPVAQWACTNSDIDASHLVLDNTAKTYVVSASHSVQELYQRAQWWSCQDAQWSADTPMTSPDGATFTLYTGWNLSGLNYVTGTQTLTGGTITLAGPATYTPTFASTTVVAQGEGTYTFTAANIVLNTTPTADNVHYVLSGCTLSGTLTVHNQNAHPITVEVPSGVTTSSSGNTGGAVTFVAPVAYQSVTVSGAVAGSRIQIYDTTAGAELYNGTPSFPYTWTDSVAASATRAIRLRVAKMSTTTAKKFIDANIGTCATSGGGLAVSYLVNQEDDDTYNTNAIDGSTVSGIAISVTGGDRVKINLAGGGVTWASIYAYQVYWQATSTGIAQETAFIEAPDTANYLVTDFDLKNVHATVPLTVTGGWGRDAVTGLSKDIVDTTGGFLFLAPDHVIPYSTGSGLTAGQAAELTAASASASSAATLAAAIPTNPLLTNDSRITTLVTKLTEVHQMDGLDSGNPVTVDASSRSSGTIAQSIAGTSTVVLTRTA